MQAALQLAWPFLQVQIFTTLSRSIKRTLRYLYFDGTYLDFQNKAVEEAELRDNSCSNSAKDITEL